MSDNKDSHKEGDGQGYEAHEEDRLSPGAAIQQSNVAEIVDGHQDGGETPPVVRAVLRGVDRQLESMNKKFSNNMAQLSAQLIAKLSKDINDAFSELRDENNRTRKSIGQVNSRVDQQEHQQAANMKRVATEIGQLSDTVEDVQDEQQAQAKSLHRLEQRLQVCEKRIENAPVVQKDGLAAPTLSPIGGEYAQGQGVRWSTPLWKSEFPPQQPEGSFDRYFGQRPARREMRLGYGDGNVPPGRMAFDDGWSRGLHHNPVQGLQAGPGRDGSRGDMQFQWREPPGYREEDDDGIGGRGYGLQRRGQNIDDMLSDKQWTGLRKSRSSKRENSLADSVQRNKTQTSLFSSSEESEDEVDSERNRKHRSSCLPKLQTFDGRASDWKGFIFNFRQVARQMKWSDKEKRDNLLTCMRGKAAVFLQGKNKERRGDYRTLRDVLAKRYGLVEPPPTARRQFNALRQEEGESVEDYADRVLVKAYEGYPGVDDEVVETLAVEGFLRGCRDRGAAYAAAEHKPATLHEALQEMRDAAANLKVFGRNNTLGTARQVTFADRVEREKHNLSKEREDMLRVLTDFFKVQQQTRPQVKEQSATNSSRFSVRDRSSSPAGNRAISKQTVQTP